MTETIPFTDITIEHFAPLVGQSLEVSIDGTTATLEVVAVAPLPTPSPRVHPPFRVTLASRAKWVGPQGVYAIAHPTLGTLGLFMTVLGPAPEGIRYEIIFN